MNSVDGKVDFIQATGNFDKASIRITGDGVTVVITVDIDTAPRLGDEYEIIFKKKLGEDTFERIEISSIPA